jgi:cytochrome c-type biogenesis protein CcmH/NrfG
MNIALVFVVLGVLALFAILYLAKTGTRTGGNLEQLTGQLRPVDVRAFRNLMSESEEQFLRENLPFREFRAVHRQRMLAATDYVRCAAHNAAILITLGEAARQSSDPEIIAAAEKLLDNALRLRLYALQTMPRLYLAIVFPGIARTPQPFADAYDTMTRQVVMLGLQYPTHGIASAL